MTHVIHSNTFKHIPEDELPWSEPRPGRQATTVEATPTLLEVHIPQYSYARSRCRAVHHSRLDDVCRVGYERGNGAAAQRRRDMRRKRILVTTIEECFLDDRVRAELTKVDERRSLHGHPRAVPEPHHFLLGGYFDGRISQGTVSRMRRLGICDHSDLDQVKGGSQKLSRCTGNEPRGHRRREARAEPILQRTEERNTDRRIRYMPRDGRGRSSVQSPQVKATAVSGLAELQLGLERIDWKRGKLGDRCGDRSLGDVVHLHSHRPVCPHVE